MKKTIVFDFDGVIHKYSKGWFDGSIYDEPNQNVITVIDALRRNDYIVDIVSTRSRTEQGAKEIGDWLEKYGIEVDHILSEKPPAIAYIDDRAINYNPLNTNLYTEIINFKPLNKKIEEYKKLNELELLKTLKDKNDEFVKVNKIFDDNVKDPILAILIMDDWINAVKKYINI